jgi:antitoxin CptB
MTSPLDARRRRAAYRAAHRGTKEMDWLLGRFAEARLGVMTDSDLGRFERLLVLPDPDLQEWIMTGAGYGDGEFSALIGEIRVYHGLVAAKA